MKSMIRPLMATKVMRLLLMNKTLSAIVRKNIDHRLMATVISSGRHQLDRQIMYENINQLLAMNSMKAKTDSKTRLRQEIIASLPSDDPMVKTLNISQWIEDIEEYTIDINDYDDPLTSLLCSKYFTRDTCDQFMNIKYCTNNGLPIEMLNANQSTDIDFQSNQFNESHSMKQCLKQIIVNKNINIRHENPIYSFASQVLYNLDYDIPDVYLTKNLLTFNIYYNSIRNTVTGRADLLVRKNCLLNGPIGLTMAFKSMKQLEVDGLLYIENAKSQLICELIASANENQRRLGGSGGCTGSQSNNNSINRIDYGILVASTKWYITGAQITDSYLTALSTKRLTAADPKLILFDGHYWTDGLDWHCDNQRKHIIRFLINLRQQLIGH
ncbi:uncharacterized protein LOC128959347 [Oppia nitens]|uniref:uncharacterized protein LOC128959347 n=1 Tax=Oppia nitens TaxID=1686743 RepID=UPI0023DABF64|nr:uncharacterized protein LOC128959347 [Oppia nitens]